MKKINNRGITLIELIVSIAIAVIVGASILSFMIIGIRQYKTSSNEVDLQYEAQLVDNQIHDMLIDVSAGIDYRVGTTESTTLVSAVNDEAGYGGEAAVAALAEEEEGATATKVKKLVFYDWDTTGADQKKIVSAITWNEADQELVYSSYQYTGTETEPTETSLMAEYVSDFKVDLAQMTGKNQVTYKLGFKNGERTYQTENTVTLRNNVAVNSEEMDKIFTDIIEQNSRVTGVKIVKSPDYATQGMACGVAFEASVEGDLWPSQKVYWYLLKDKEPSAGGPSDPSTSIDPNTGILTLGELEKSQDIEIVAVSAQSLAENNNDFTKAAKATTSISTRYISGIVLSRPEGAVAGRNQTLILKINGVNLPKETEMFEDSILVSFEARSNGPLSGVDVDKGELTPNEQGEQFVYNNIKVVCRDSVADGLGVNITATLSAYGKEFKSKPVGFNTGQPVKKLSNTQIVDAKTGEKVSEITLERGDIKSYKVQIKRKDGEFVDADDTVDVTWTFENENEDHKGYAKCNEQLLGKEGSNITGSGTTAKIEMLKDPEALPYGNGDGEIDITARVVDKLYGKEESSTIEINAAEVKITSFAPKYNQVAFGGTIVFDAQVSGILLDKNDVRLYSGTDGYLNYDVVNFVESGSNSITVTDSNKISIRTTAATPYTNLVNSLSAIATLQITKASGYSYSSGGVARNYNTITARSSNVKDQKYYVPKPTNLTVVSNEIERTAGSIIIADGKEAKYSYTCKITGQSWKVSTIYVTIDNVKYKYKENKQEWQR